MINPEQEKINAIERSASDAVIHYSLRIQRLYKEKTGVDLLEVSPVTLGLFVNAASNEFQSGYIGNKLEGLSKHAFSLGHGDIDHEAALDDAMNEANDCFTEAVSCFHALSTVSRKVEQASYQEQFEFASKHHQLFVSYFSLFRAVYQRSLNEMAMRGVAGDE
ncbi:MAG: hypothetical protein KDF59_12405 [Nitrosomonas sp.]|nr:hypothetical protein [Nitrosomonas sp.]